MFLLKKILTALILPPASLILLALLGLWLIARNRGRGRTIGIVLSSLSLSALLALSLPAVSQRLLAPLQTLPPISAAQLADVQAIVVLGGGIYHEAPEYGGDTVKYYTLERLRYAARLARQSGQPLLLTGGAPSDGTSEAHAMREVLQNDFGLSTKWIEDASLDTADNARLSALQLKAAGVSRIALVSHAWHLPRAIPLFEREGLQVIPAPTAFAATGETTLLDWFPDDYRLTRIALHEYLGRAVNLMRQLF